MEKCERLMTMDGGLSQMRNLYQIQGHTFISHKLFQEENWKKMTFE